MADNLINGKIVAVTTATAESVHSDSVLVEFTLDGEKIERDFLSPYLNEENLRSWRRLVLYAVWQQKISADDSAITDFEKYKSDLLARPVKIAYDAEDDIIFGIGKNEKNLFYPEEYKLYSGPVDK